LNPVLHTVSILLNGKDKLVHSIRVQQVTIIVSLNLDCVQSLRNVHSRLLVLPSDLRLTTNTNSFKKKLKAHFY